MQTTARNLFIRTQAGPGLLALMFALASLHALATDAPGSPAIYTCTTADGRKLTSDRLIPECASREHQVLNRDGSLRAILPPLLSSDRQGRENPYSGHYHHDQRRSASAVDYDWRSPTRSGPSDYYDSQSPVNSRDYHDEGRPASSGTYYDSLSPVNARDYYDQQRSVRSGDRHAHDEYSHRHGYYRRNSA